MAKSKIGVVDISQRNGADKSPVLWPSAQPRQTFTQQVNFEALRVADSHLESDPFNILILNYTMSCPLACDYCCYECGPNRKETMNLDLALNLIDQAAELGVFSECGFTGGEPLVYFDDVLQLTERMQQYQFPFSMISACHWANDKSNTYNTIDPLAERGMSVFTVSHDPSHEKWVDRKNIYRTVDRVLEHGVRVVICGSFYDDSQNIATLFPEYVDNTQVSFVSRVVLPTQGRAKRKGVEPSLYPQADLLAGGTCYKRVYHDVTVFWDGEVYPCCSVHNRETPGISYGNVYESSLADIWDRISGSLFLRMIKREGFDALQRFVEQRDPDLARQLPSADQAVGPCHWCHLMMKDADISKQIHDLFFQEEKSRVKQLIAQLTQDQGEAVARRFMSSALNP